MDERSSHNNLDDTVMVGSRRRTWSYLVRHDAPSSVAERYMASNCAEERLASAKSAIVWERQRPPCTAPTTNPMHSSTTSPRDDECPPVRPRPCEPMLIECCGSSELLCCAMAMAGASHPAASALEDARDSTNGGAGGQCPRRPAAGGAHAPAESRTHGGAAELAWARRATIGGGGQVRRAWAGGDGAGVAVG